MTFLQKLFAVTLVLALSGCATYPKPDPALISYNRADPEKDAAALAKTIYGAVWLQEGMSMSPFLMPGDWLVGDFTQIYEWIQPSHIDLYDPNWADASLPFVDHMAVEKTGDAWVMSGLNNQYSESGERAMTSSDYRARVVAVFTKRAKP